MIMIALVRCWIHMSDVKVTSSFLFVIAHYMLNILIAIVPHGYAFIHMPCLERRDILLDSSSHLLIIS